MGRIRRPRHREVGSPATPRTPATVAGVRRAIKRATRALWRTYWWRRPLVIAGLVAITIWAALKALPVHGAPQAEPPTVVAMTPASLLHSATSGYVIGVRLYVKSCGQPVTGVIAVGIPGAFDKVEDRFGGSPPSAPLIGAAISDPTVRMGYVKGSLPASAADQLPSWSWTFSGNPAIPRFFETGKVAVGRFDNWPQSDRSYEIVFSADWLHPRGYDSCWLSLPELISPDSDTFGIHAAESVNKRLGSASHATPLVEGSSSGTTTMTYREANGRTRTVIEHTYQGNSYTSGAVPAAVGWIWLSTGLHLLPAESLASAPSFGTPRWTCQDLSPGAGAIGTPTDLNLGLGPDGGWRFEHSRPLAAFVTAAQSTRGCGGWIALATASAETDRTTWLLIIGATLSLAMAVLVDAIVAGNRTRHAKDGKGSSDDPGDQAVTDRHGPATQ
jgi:hypothetical protein